MTAFHEAIVAYDPVVFVPFDAPGDTTILANNLGSAGGSLGRSIGGTIQAAPGGPTFSNELALDGVDDYWSANSTMFNALKTAIAAAGTTGVTAAIWWRTLVYDATIRFLFRLDPWGMGMYRLNADVRAEFYNLNDALAGIAFASLYGAERGGGWQLSALQIDPVELDLFVCRNGVRTFGTAITAGNQATIRTTSTTSFVVGKNPSSGTTNMWSGSLGPLMIWDRALNGDELMNVYNAGVGVAAPRYPYLRRTDEQKMRPDLLMRGT